MEDTRQRYAEYEVDMEGNGADLLEAAAKTKTPIVSIEQGILEKFGKTVLEPLPNRCYRIGDYKLTPIGHDRDAPGFIEFWITKSTPVQLRLFEV